jgi:hypothetical protein
MVMMLNVPSGIGTLTILSLPSANPPFKGDIKKMFNEKMFSSKPTD